VDNEVARPLGPVLQARLGQPVRYYGDVYHALDRAAATYRHPTVRRLVREDLGMRISAPDEIRGAVLGFGPLDCLLDECFAVGAVLDGNPVSLACTTAQTLRHADLGVATAAPWQGRGLATACASLAAKEVQQAGQVPVWSTGEDNIASLRVARKIGFAEVGRRTYVIPARRYGPA
jgi:RimJ/RimL family protein N-acetyltransferase